MRTIFSFPSLENPMKNVTRMRLEAKLILATIAWMCFGNLFAQEQERDLERVFIPEARVKAIEASRAGGVHLVASLGPAVCGRFRVAKFVPRVGAGQRQTLGGEPRPQDDHLGLSSTDHRVRHVGRIGCGWESYALNPTNAVGYADTLTSRRLLLGGNVPGDSVALSFWYQSGGIANGADAGEDSLIVEFRNTAEDDPWQWVWSTEGIDNDTAFHPVVVPIVGTEYFHNEFQFRILNYGSLKATWIRGISTLCGWMKTAWSLRHCLKRWRLWHRRQASCVTHGRRCLGRILSTLWTATLRPR